MVVNDASHTRYVNLVVHDGGIGFYTYAPPVDVEVSGCLFYNNGWEVPRQANGHAIYAKSNTGPLVLRDNIAFDQFGYGLHVYTEARSGLLNNIRLEGNVVFNNGTLSAKSGAANILVGGRARADAIVAQGNLAYFSPGVFQTNAVFGWRNAIGVRNGTLTLSRNYFVGGSVVLDLHAWERWEASDNTLYGPGARPIVAVDAAVQPLDGTNHVLAAAPSQPAVFVRANAYEAGRANVVVYNWSQQDTVPVALSGVLRRGDRYAVYNVQDFFGAPVAGGVYAGEAVRIPMRGVAPPAPLVSTVAGAPGAPLVVRRYGAERAVLDAAAFSSDTVRRDFFIVRGDYTTLWGLEFTDSDPNRGTASRPNLLVNNASHTRYVNLTVHDGGIAFFTYPNRTDVEVSGCIVYNNGWSVTGVGNGHGLYVKSDAGPLLLRDNVLFDQFGFGIHAYTDATDRLLNNITVEGNASFNNGLLAGSPSGSNVLVGGLAPANGIVVDSNMTFFSPGVVFPNVWLGWSKSQVVNGSLQVRNNYVVGGAAVFDVHAWQSVTASGNTLAPGGGGEVVRLNDSSTTDAAGYRWEGDSYYTDPTDTAWSYHDTTYTFAGWRAKTGLGATDQATAAGPAAPAG